MERRRKPATRVATGRVKSDTTSQWSALQYLVENKGSITVGYVAPISCAAVASDQHNMLAALQCRRGESISDLLDRLEAAVVIALDDGIYADEING